MIDKSRFVANLAPAAMKIKHCGPVWRDQTATWVPTSTTLPLGIWK
jgi:hypothetical protein